MPLAPVPSAVAEFHGNKGKRAKNHTEPKPRAGTPRCPSWLSREAKRHWQRIVPELKHMKVLTMIDADAVAAYCTVYARWKEAEQFINKHGICYSTKEAGKKTKNKKPDTDGGYKHQYPHVAVARNLLQLVKTYQQELGLTPSARTRLHESGVRPDDELEDFVKNNAG